MKSQLVVVGAGGRMGKRLVAMAAESQQFDLVGAIDAAGHPQIGKDAGLVAGIDPMQIYLTDVFPDTADVVIDFSLPQATDKTLVFCRQNEVSLVLGTTGLNDRQKNDLKTLTKLVPVVQATNMSVGMNALFALVGKVANMLGEDYDIEIVEHHHRFKKDAPSGTALSLAENICEETGRTSDDVIFGRSGSEALRDKKSIGIHAVRAGDTVGIHSVIYGTLGETVTLSHTAHSRDNFVRGALRAAGWVIKRSPGLYSMRDVLGFK